MNALMCFDPMLRLLHSPILKASSLAVAVALCGCSSTPTPTCDQELLQQDESEGNAGCLIVQDSAVVMVQQSLTGAWSVPGGTAEEGELAVCTAARETYEETGLRVRVVKKLRVLNKNFHLYYCVVENSTINQTPYKNTLVPVDAIEIRSAAWQTAQQRQQLQWRFPAQQELIDQLADQLSEAP